MIRLIMVDDDLLVRDCLRMRLSDIPEIVLVGEASNGRDGIALCKKENPDVVLIDISMPHMDGLEATRLIKEYNKNINVVILTSHAYLENIQKAKKYRCNGFIYKEAGTDDFASVIKNVYNGFDVWSKELLYTDGVVNFNNEKFDESELEQLSEKEIMLIKCKVRGIQYREIANEINYSEAYVRQLAVQLKDKLGLESVNELTAWGAKRGL